MMLLCTSSELMANELKTPVLDSARADANEFAIRNMCEQLNIPYAKGYDAMLLMEVIDWMGSPYAYGLCSKDGTDCSGFTKEVIKSVYGINLVHSSAGIFGQCEAVIKQDLQQGDLVFFKIYKKRISHVGIYLADGYFIHASTRAGVIVSSLNEPYYLRTFYSGGRLNK